MNDVITLCFPAKIDYIAPIRLAVSGIVNNLNLDVYQLENVKSCITEACMLLVCSQECREFHVSVNITDNSLKINVHGSETHKIRECRNCMQFSRDMAEMMISAMSTSSELIHDDDGALQQVVFDILL